MGVSHSRGLTKPPLRPSYFVFTAKETVLSQVVTEITWSSLSDVISIPLCGHFARAREGDTRVSLSRARSFLRPLLPSACYAA